jgi:Ca2+/Na+ antiporter
MKRTSMKPDYAKILFISFPLTFIVWFLCLIGLTYVTHNRDIIFYTAPLLAVTFFILFVFFSIRYSKRLKTEMDQKVPQSDGIILFVLVIAVVAVLAVAGIFYNIPVNESYKYVVITCGVLTIIWKLLKKRT